MKTHFIIEVSEEFNYILACGLKYKDSDNCNFSKNIDVITCQKCLSVLSKDLQKGGEWMKITAEELKEETHEILKKHGMTDPLKISMCSIELSQMWTKLLKSVMNEKV